MTDEKRTCFLAGPNNTPELMVDALLGRPTKDGGEDYSSMTRDDLLERYRDTEQATGWLPGGRVDGSKRWLVRTSSSMPGLNDQAVGRAQTDDRRRGVGFSSG